MQPSELFQYREKEIELPSGYIAADGTLHKTVIIRELTGAEEDLLLDEENARNGNSFSAVLDRVSRLKDNPAQKFVSELLMVDQLFLIVQIRALTYGNSYRFNVECPAPQCKKQTKVDLELDSLAFEGAKNPSSMYETVTVPSGIEFKFKKNQAKDQSNLYKIATGAKKDKVSEVLKYRLVSVTKNGEELSKDIVKSLPGQDRKLLREAMTKSEGNSETQIKVKCVHCNSEIRTELPLDSNFFCLTVEEE